MNREYPARPKVAAWARYLCMAFGVANIVGGIDMVLSSPLDLFLLLGAFLVGGAWFAFGLYGGLPLVSTVREWYPAATPEEVNAIHRRGLLVMRTRKWITWVSVLGAFIVAFFLTPVLMQANQPGLTVLVLGVPLAIIYFRYLLSRCPRCGYGFFTQSTSRAAMINLRKTCGHCGLSLHAYKDHKA
jgi:ribosomal protein S27AE